ncbi:MAG TPA: retropepsin-like aspartic protease [Streptosporangiaceae bacterium]|nr:retropepsin-like aspartic protease [Streptosporangiaceae bacterium]
MTDLRVTLERDPDDQDCAVPFADGTVAGRPYRFLLDTGAARTRMIADEYTTNLCPAGTDSGHAAFGAVTETIVTVADLSVGPMRAPSLDVTLADGAAAGAPSLLGMDVIGRYSCHFRFAAGVVGVGARGAGTDELYTGSRGHVYVDVGWPEAAGVSASANWDSGAGITIVHEGFWLAHRELFTDLGTTEGTDASGARVATPLVLMSGPVIGRRPFAPHRAAVVDLTAANATLDRPMDLILGYPTWSQADWIFDFPGRTWALTS